MSDHSVVVRRLVPVDDSPVEYHLIGISDWDFFDSLISFFVKYYSASVESADDGIVTRSYQLRARDEYFMVKHHQDIGNWFFSCAEVGDSALMRTIAEDLENRLKEIPFEGN